MQIASLDCDFNSRAAVVSIQSESEIYLRLDSSGFCFGFRSSVPRQTTISVCRSCCSRINMTYHTVLSHYWSMLSRQMRIDSRLPLLASLEIDPKGARISSRYRHIVELLTSIIVKLR
jgi:hypothetical protein